MRLVRNTRHCFLLGASWGHVTGAPNRLVHVYLGPWLLTITMEAKR